jgi:hypothetical protein
MARYFFHIVDGEFRPDSVGEELETLADAQRAAITRVSTAAAARQESFWTGHGLRLIVTDVGGETIFDLNLKGEIFPIRSQSRSPDWPVAAKLDNSGNGEPG